MVEFPFADTRQITVHFPCRGMNFQIQQINVEDWERFRAIRLRALADTPDAFGSTLAREKQFSEAEWQRRAGEENAATFIANSDDGTDLGLSTGSAYDDEAGLYRMWVAPEARERGIGSALVDAVVTWARANGFKRLFLDVANENTSAIALYSKKGFHPTGVTGTLPPPREHVLEHQRELRLHPED